MTKPTPRSVYFLGESQTCIIPVSPNPRLITNMRDYVGELPEIFNDGITWCEGDFSFDSVVKNLNDAYAARASATLPEITGGRVDLKSFVYSYPSDPDLQPLVVVMNNDVEGVKFVVYQYAIVAIIVGESVYVTRMD